MRKRDLWLLSVCAAATAAFLAFTVPASAQTAAENTYPGFYAAEDHLVEFYSDDELLLDSSYLTMSGRATEEGGCEFGFPVLSLGPDENVIHARQVATNFTECTTVIEIGVPLHAEETPNDLVDGTGETVEAKAVGRGAKPNLDGGFSTKATGSSSAYYKVWWEDVINLKVTEAKSNISWAYNGSCVTAASGSLDTWWLTATGWSKNSSGSWVTSGCASRTVYSDATFKNGAFCWPGTVWNYYDNVSVKGTATNGLSGWVDSTWTTYPFACPTLHYHTQLTRVTG